MPSYNFKAQFVSLIRSGRKRQTMRQPRKRRTKEGERLYLFTGPRNKPVRLGEAICERVHDVAFRLTKVELDLDGEKVTNLPALDAFARKDGFGNWMGMVEWFARTYPGETMFKLELVTWRDFVPDRLDVMEDWPGPIIENAEVFLDGEKVTQCVAFCVSESWAETYARDADGDLRKDEGQALIRERKYGNVEVKVDWAAVTGSDT